MKILMVCGSYPPEQCGIGDYLYNIVQNLNQSPDLSIDFLINIDWSNKNIFKILKKVKSYKAEIIHIQYPSQGYGMSFAPHFISIFNRCIVTVHEVSHVKFLRRLSLFFYSIRSQVIFTNEFEYKNFKKLFFWYKKKPIIIPIGSNIPIKFQPKINISESLKKEIIYFGQIRPKKGIEELIELGKILQQNKSEYKVVIMGQILPAFKDYWEQIKLHDNIKNIEWRLNQTEDGVAINIRNATYAYLPFPDGISERRGSFFAALACGTPIFTNKGHQTTTEISTLVNFVETPNDVYQSIITRLPDYYYSKLNIENIERFLENHSWPKIAEEHLSLYKHHYKQ